MAVMILLSIATCVSLVTILFACLICRRKLSDQEIQQKAFEKFRKRHMLYRDRILSSRVDYVRSVSEGKASSCISGVSDHTYEEMSSPPIPHPPIVHVQEPSPLHSSDHSFFDDSFQTVIEASSSSNVSSSNSGRTNLLSAPRDHQASYISLQQGTSQTCLRTAIEQAGSESEGEVNQGFSDSANSSEGNMGSADSLNDSYIVPSCGPKIKIVKPSVKRKFELTFPLTIVQNNLSSELQLPVRERERDAAPRNKYKRLSDSARLSSEKEMIGDAVFSEDRDNTGKNEQNFYGDEKLKQKIAIEGPTYSERRSSLDSNGNSIYEELRSSRNEQPMYISLHKTALVLPGRPRMFSPMTPLRSSEANPERSRPGSPAQSRRLTSKASGCSDHTYESINSILTCEINRRDSVASVEPDSTFNNTSENYVEEQNDLGSISPGHTYESIKSKVQSELEKSEIACENSAVIIGRRVSNPFDSNKLSKRMINKKKQRSMKNNGNNSAKKAQKDIEERYSPFPSAKKLAFKSAFKQVSSPRFSVIQTVTGNMNSQIVFNPEMCPDNLNIKTPEIKVENCSQFFDNTAYISPKVLNANTIFTEDESGKDTIDFISPMPTYLTLRDCISSKVSNTNLQTSLTEKRLNYRKSLPSLSDHLEDDFVRHCNTNVYSRSTPCELDQDNSNFF